MIGSGTSGAQSSLWGKLLSVHSLRTSRGCVVHRWMLSISCLVHTLAYRLHQLISSRAALALRLQSNPSPWMQVEIRGRIRKVIELVQ